jgi:hypothetical protein
MWYIAEILFAQPKQADRRMYLCESCNVLFRAENGEEAYRKATAWGAEHEADSNLRLLGVSHMSSIGEELAEGVDIAGRFFHKRDVWDRQDKLIPSPEELKAIHLEQNMHTPLGDLMTSRQVRMLNQTMGEAP